MPAVSVIMAVYNGGEDVIRAIKSVERQTFRDFQFIITDDCSIDGTYDRIARYLWCSSINWCILRNDHNLGNDYTALKAYKCCNSKWMIRIDHDDEFCDNTIETLITGCDGCGLVYGPYQEIYPDCSKIVLPNNLMECLACGVLYNVESVAKVGGYLCFDVGIFYEYDLNIRLSNSGVKILAKPDVVYKYYRRPGSVTHDKDKVIDSVNKIRAKWGDEWADKIRSY